MPKFILSIPYLWSLTLFPISLYYKHPLNNLLQIIIALIFPEGNILEVEFQGRGLHHLKPLNVYIAKLSLRKAYQSTLLSAVQV